MESHTLTFLVGVDGRLFALSVVGSGAKADPKHLAEPLRRERSERLECYRKAGADLEADVQDGGATLHVRLRDLPRLSVGNVLVPHTGDRHGILQSLAEMESVDVPLKRSLERGISARAALSTS